MSRGYVNDLEQRVREAESRRQQLEAHLVSLGVDPKSVVYHDPGVVSLLEWNASAQDAHAQMWASQTATTTAAATSGPAPQAQMGYPAQTQPPSSPRASQETNLFALPFFRTGTHGDNYLGVASSSAGLSSINGTALSVLGTEIDIADFSSSDIDEPAMPSFNVPLFNKSYHSFLQSSLNLNGPIDKVDLPPREEGYEHAHWYLDVLNPYLPVLHGPSFKTLVCISPPPLDRPPSNGAG